jgi:hypothetical protein
MDVKVVRGDAELHAYGPLALGLLVKTPYRMMRPRDADVMARDGMPGSGGTLGR